MKSRLDWGVFNALQNTAKEILKQPNILAVLPCDKRDLEILANARICDKCGYIYEMNDYINGCPNCESVERTSLLDDLADDISDLRSEIGNIGDILYDINSNLNKLK